MSGVEINAKGKTRATRGTENRTHRVSADPDRERGIAGTRFESGDLDRGTDRTVGTEAISSTSLAGGILTQLIATTHDQLGETLKRVRDAEECIRWYEREKGESESRVQLLEEQLRQLQLLQAQSEQIDSD